MISSGLMTRSGIRICVLVALGGLAGLSLFLIPTAMGQKRTVTKPNLSGLWVLDKSKKSSKGVVENLTVLIQQNEPEIRITRRAATGGEERVDKVELKSVTKWEGNKLMIRSQATTQLSKGGHSTIEPGRIEKWQVSKDGLLYWTTSSTFDGAGPVVEAMVKANLLPPAEDIKRVFRRAP
jgi:hypothetical protein